MGTLFEVDSSGQLQQKLSLGSGAEVTKTFAYPSTAMEGGAAPAGTVIVNGVNFFRTFDPDTTQDTLCNVVMPSDYKDGTDITFKFVWGPNTAGTGNVRWRFQINQTEEGESFDSGGTTTVASNSAAPGVIYQRVAGPTLTLSGTGTTSDTTIGVCVERLATGGEDTYTGNALLFCVIVGYTADSLGD
jgi:hypothetical protein